MGMDNRLLVLDKSKEKVEQLRAFFIEITNRDDNYNSEYKLSTYDIDIVQYGDYWGLETELRNSGLVDLEYWLETKDKKDIVKDSLAIINYENSDYAVMYRFFDDEYSEQLFDIFDNTMCEEGKVYEEVLPMDNIRRYFCVKYR